MNKKPLINEIIATISYIYMYIFENPEIMVKSGVLTERFYRQQSAVSAAAVSPVESAVC